MEEERRGTRATEPHKKGKKKKKEKKIQTKMQKKNKTNIFTFLSAPKLLKTNKQARQVDLRGETNSKQNKD